MWKGVVAPLFQQEEERKEKDIDTTGKGVITLYMVLKLNLDPLRDNPPLQAGSREPPQGGGLTKSTIKAMLPFLPWQGPELQDIQGHRGKTNMSRAVLGRTRNKNDDKVRWERFISGHYSFCNGFFFFF